MRNQTKGPSRPVAKLVAPPWGAGQPGTLPVEGAELRLWSGRRGWVRLAVLIAILAAATVLHTIDPRQSPPGNLDDECMDIWNAYCLLKNGTDWHGVSWPVFYSRGIGDNRPMLFAYLLIPFQAVLGMSLWSGRFASGMMGVADILLAYVIGRKLFNSRTAGLVGAALLTLTPWHIRSCRTCFYAHPFFLLLPLALVLMANLPLQNAQKRPPRPVLAGLAGAVTGLCCYTYPGIRLFLPIFFVAVVLATWRGWRELLRTRQGRVAFASLLLGIAATFGPLLYKSLTDPGMNRRAETLRLWDPLAGWGTNLKAVLSRYPPHYGPSFLFLQGDGQELRYVRRIPGVGWFQWDVLPWLLVGLGMVLVKARSSHAARVVLVGLIVAPVPDIFFQADGPHAYRSLAVLPAVWLVATAGLTGAGAWLWRRRRKLFLPAAVVLALGSCASNIYFLRQFFWAYNQEYYWYLEHDAHLVEACRWLKPRLKPDDVVFITQPIQWHSVWLISLVEFGYDPKRWFAGSRHFQYNCLGVGEPGKRDWDWCKGYGRIHFMAIDDQFPEMRFDNSEWEPILLQLAKGGRTITAYFVIGPDSMDKKVKAEPVHRVLAPDETDALWIYRLEVKAPG